MERKNKACWNCRFYKAYYTKGFSGFNKEKCGLCTQENAIKNNQESCIRWQSNQLLRALRKQSAIRALTKALNDISEIQQILGEEQQEDN